MSLFDEGAHTEGHGDVIETEFSVRQNEAPHNQENKEDTTTAALDQAKLGIAQTVEDKVKAFNQKHPYITAGAIMLGSKVMADSISPGLEHNQLVELGSALTMTASIMEAKMPGFIRYAAGEVKNGVTALRDKVITRNNSGSTI